MRIRRRRRYTLALAIAACVLGMLTAIVALTLPFWADLEEDLAAPIALLAATLSATPLLHLSSHQTSSQSGPETHLFTAIATTGCGRPAPTRPGMTTVDRLSVGALTRDYRLHVPSTYQPRLKTALVLSFHGHGSTAVLQEQRTGLSHLADLRHFITVYPQGAIGPDGQTGWNTGRRKDPSVDDVSFVDHLITALQRSLCIDPQRIYAAGYSNGGGMTAILACEFSSRIAAFAPVAGDYYPQPGGCHPNHPASLLEIHGTADAVNPYGGSAALRYPAVGAWLAAWAQRDGCVQEPIVTTVGQGVTMEEWLGCKGDAVILHYRLSGVGHVWPEIASNATSGSNTASGFDASTAIWTFFSQRTLSSEQAPAA